MNNEFILVIGLALLPAFGNFSGGILAEWLSPSQKRLNLMLHVAAGILLAVIAVEIMPAALQKTTAWWLAIAFLAGGVVYILTKAAIEHWQQSKPAKTGTGAWMVYLAVVVDLLGDGLLIGAGSAVSSQLALALALGQVLADIPEGFAVIVNFREKGLKRSKRLLISASFAIPVVGAAVFAYFALRGQNETIKMMALVFIAGLYILAAVEDMLREAHESAEDNRWSAMGFLVGFALFLSISDGLD